MNVERLVQMANDIAAYFAAEPDREEAEAGIAGHITRFWDPRMHRQILAHLADGGQGLDELARAGISRLADGARAS